MSRNSAHFFSWALGAKADQTRRTNIELIGDITREKSRIYFRDQSLGSLLEKRGFQMESPDKLTEDELPAASEKLVNEVKAIIKEVVLHDIIDESQKEKLSEEIVVLLDQASYHNLAPNSLSGQLITQGYDGTSKSHCSYFDMEKDGSLSVMSQVHCPKILVIGGQNKIESDDPTEPLITGLTKTRIDFEWNEDKSKVNMVYQNPISVLRFHDDLEYKHFNRREPLIETYKSVESLFIIQKDQKVISQTTQNLTLSPIQTKEELWCKDWLESAIVAISEVKNNLKDYIKHIEEKSSNSEQAPPLDQEKLTILYELLEKLNDESLNPRVRLFQAKELIESKGHILEEDPTPHKCSYFEIIKNICIEIPFINSNEAIIAPPSEEEIQALSSIKNIFDNYKIHLEEKSNNPKLPIVIKILNKVDDESLSPRDRLAKIKKLIEDNRSTLEKRQTPKEWDLLQSIKQIFIVIFKIKTEGEKTLDKINNLPFFKADLQKIKEEGQGDDMTNDDSIAPQR